MSNEQKTAKIRAALDQLDKANDTHWTDDGLPREGIVRKLAGDTTLSRKDISEAYPGFQRTPAQADAPNADKATKPTDAVPEVKAAAEDPLTGEPTDLGPDPTKNTGEFMSDDEVHAILDQRVKDATQGLADAQQSVRDSNKAVIDAQAALVKAREDLTREFPPMTAAENIKQYIKSEMAQREALMHPGMNGIAPGSQIDAAMQRGNSRGWRRPTRVGVTQTGANRA